MSPDIPARRRRPTGQDGVGALAAVAGAAAAVLVVAGGGWAIARSGSGGSTTGAGGPSSTTTQSGGTNSTSTSSPSQSPSHTGQNTSWSRQCGKAAGVASHHGFGVLAPSELPAGWSLRSCHYSTSTGWHMVVSTGHSVVSVDQRTGSVSTMLDGVLGSGSHQGKDVHAMGTGTWQSWTASGGRTALSRAMSSTGAVISGRASVHTLARLADSLLTYESAPAGNNGG